MVSRACESRMNQTQSLQTGATHRRRGRVTLSGRNPPACLSVDVRGLAESGASADGPAEPEDKACRPPARIRLFAQEPVGLRANPPRLGRAQLPFALHL